ncbi:MAG: tRNA lysidine(34) synthetase TilS [Prevotellaceae bacterium]|jgi:tRNA(Ile)-lysidine synthase|nr:tRNA lysidine(34) synthetase TilS [Prevotellaceae bacterium]
MKQTRLFQHFQRYCATHRLYDAESRWLVAVSGGVDSMTLAHLCLDSGWTTGIAHCNFGLRGEESDGDALFVKEWAHANHIPFFSTCFDTEHYAKNNGLSIQMAARNLRYEWLEDLRMARGYTAIAVAHHADDNAETVLINLLRGTGLKGLRGMQPASGHIVRPLLFALRRDIMAYARKHAIAYREDRTNASDDYLRNRIRHTLMPAMQKISPSATTTIITTASHLAQANRVIDTEKERVAAACCSYTGNEVRISIAALKAVPHYDFWLFELIRDYHFSGAVTSNILEALDGQAGKQFNSASHTLIKDRNELIITPLMLPPAVDERHIAKNFRMITQPVPMRFDYRTKGTQFVISPKKNTACLAADKLKFPLLLRPWRDGDAFIPFGMKGSKKISDFLIDEKIPLHEKARQYVLVSGAEIVWLVGRRIDERYKVTPDTPEELVITLRSH